MSGVLTTRTTRVMRVYPINTHRTMFIIRSYSVRRPGTDWTFVRENYNVINEIICVGSTLKNIGRYYHFVRIRIHHGACGAYT